MRGRGRVDGRRHTACALRPAAARACASRPLAATSCSRPSPQRAHRCCYRSVYLRERSVQHRHEHSIRRRLPQQTASAPILRFHSPLPDVSSSATLTWWATSDRPRTSSPQQSRLQRCVGSQRRYGAWRGETPPPPPHPPPPQTSLLRASREATAQIVTSRAACRCAAIHHVASLRVGRTHRRLCPSARSIRE